jgi:hypothetical protein
MYGKGSFPEIRIQNHQSIASVTPTHSHLILERSQKVQGYEDNNLIGRGENV